jgi:hypothetical protein
MRVNISADGADARALYVAVAATRDFAAALPEKVKVDRAEIAPTEHWIDDAFARAPSEVRARWHGTPTNPFAGPHLSIASTGVVGWYVPRDTNAAEVIELATALPLQVMVMGPHPAWKTPTDGFSGVHRSHGWAVIFKAHGHDRLVSRRWLDHGPWQLRHEDGDITYVQFHDLDVSREQAWDQASRAHQRMGIDYDVGGYVYAEHPIATRISGLYKAADRSFTVTRGNGQPMAQREMLDLCVYRARMRDDAKGPIERVRVLFLEERDARRHLHELWLRELECWYVDVEGREVRADEGYAPARIRPEWVERAEGAATVQRAPAVRFERGLGQLVSELELGDWTRDDLLFQLLDHHDPGNGYSVREILDADVPRVSASAGETGELVVSAAQGVGGAMAAAEAGPILEQARAVAAQLETWVPAERLGLTLPAILVPDPYLDQRPIRLGDDHPLRGVVVHGIGDVLARVRSLNREDLREVEALLRLCAEQRLVVSARAPR